MGLGWIAVGYLFCIDPFHVFLYTGSAVCFFAAGSKLSAQHPAFLWMKRASVALFAVGIAGAVCEVPGFFGSAAVFPPFLTSVVYAAAKLTLLCVVLCACTGIAALARVQAKKTVRAGALRGRIFSVLYYLPAAALEFVDVSGSAFWVVLTAAILLIGVMVYLLNLWFFFDAWRSLAPPQDGQPGDQRQGGRFL